MKKLFVTIVVACVLAAASVHYSYGQTSEDENDSTPKCAPFEFAMKTLKDDFGEKVVWTGKEQNGNRLVVTQSEKGTWTLLGVTANGQIACMLANDGRPPEPKGDKT